MKENFGISKQKAMSWTLIAIAAILLWLFYPRQRAQVGNTDRGHGGYYSSASMSTATPSTRVPKFVPANHTSPEEVRVEMLDRIIQPGHTSKVKN